ncbi:MAG: hypothetical protein R3274_03475 [Desulfobacterales bacterium]|nr:hypothetical protein [Desulfobacterales bacterium]
MNSKIITFSIAMISLIFLISSLTFAGGQGKNKSKSTPPGWEQGEKTGWKGKDKPPGLTEDKIEKKHKAKMNEGDQDEAADIKEKAEKKQKKHKEQYESEIETEKQKRDAELETEKEKLKSRTNKKDS